MTAHDTLAAALSAVQGELPTVGKANTAKVATKNGPDFSYRYADLSDVTEKIMPLLSKHGLAFTAVPTVVDGMFVLSFALLHDSGQERTGSYPLPPAATPPQQLGSAITYARRYALCAVTGVAPGGDDDDAAQAMRARQDSEAETPPQTYSAPPAEWRALIAGCETFPDLNDVYERANTEGWATPPVMQALTARKKALHDA